jgi:hypothetical protein
MKEIIIDNFIIDKFNGIFNLYNFRFELCYLR